MKKDPVIGVLVAVLALSTVASAVLCFGYIKNSRELRQLNGQLIVVNSRRNAVQALYNDAVEYSKKNPGIIPILEAVSPRARQAVTNAPAR